MPFTFNPFTGNFDYYEAPVIFGCGDLAACGLNNLGDVTLAAVARGDILRRGAAVWNNYGLGAAGQYLRSNGVDPVWSGLNIVDDATPQLGGDLDCQGERVYDIGLLDLLAPTELTIAAGRITITQSYHTVDTEGDAATDNLDTILGGVIGRWLFIRPQADARTIVVRHGMGNIQLKGGVNVTLDEWDKGLLLFFTAGGWLDVGAESAAAAGTFVGLVDTPGAITANQVVKGNAAGAALDFGFTGVSNHMARAYLTGGDQLNLVHATPTKILLNGESYDPGGNFDAVVNNRYVAPIAGYYIINANVGFVNLIANKRYRVIIRTGNPAVNKAMAAYHSGNLNEPIYGHLTDTLYLAIGDHAELWAVSHSGGNTVDVYGGADSDKVTFLSIALLWADD